MNDPNGLIHWQGQHHLFYQHNPAAPVWSNIHWGHAVSADLVHWTDLPIALAPTAGGPDKDGCWSGVVVNDAGTPRLLYTAVFPETQCLATGSDDLITWEKYPANPVLAGPPDHLSVVGFRDPCVWQNGGTWYMTLGSGLRNVGGAVLLYRSPDLIRWEYVSVLLSGNKRVTGEMWECPAFFPLEDKYVLLISIFPRAGTVYFVGSFDGVHFHPEQEGKLDFGDSFFAPQTLLDAAGRRIMIGWIGENLSDEAQRATGWSGVQSLPRHLTLNRSGSLRMKPVPELESLRGAHCRRRERTVTSDAPVELDGVRGPSLEIAAEIDLGNAAAVGFSVLRSADGEQETVIRFSPETAHLTVEPSRSSAEHDRPAVIQSADIFVAEHDTLKLHIFVDRSVIEIFVNGHSCLTSRVYALQLESTHPRVFTQGGHCTLVTLDAWELRSIW